MLCQAQCFYFEFIPKKNEKIVQEPLNKEHHID
jgi:hypothetical protein